MPSFPPILDYNWSQYPYVNSRTLVDHCPFNDAYWGFPFGDAVSLEFIGAKLFPLQFWIYALLY